LNIRSFELLKTPHQDRSILPDSERMVNGRSVPSTDDHNKVCERLRSETESASPADFEVTESELMTQKVI